MSYTYKELVEAYRELGVDKNSIIYVTSNIGLLMEFEKPDKTAVLEAHFCALKELLGDSGTLVVPTASLDICNTTVAFDLLNTPSFESGIFSEYVRQKPGVLRSFHPFVSYAAIGPQAENITQNITRNAFGIDTPEHRMIELNAKCIIIGLPPRFSCSTAHHVEQIMNVPYRYTKEYMHPVVRGTQTVIEPFYQHVMYRNSDVARSACERIFKLYKKTNEIKNVDVGRGKIFTYPIAGFVSAAIEMFKDDIYIWCKETPNVRPWQK